MKKKLVLIAVMVALFVCILAASVSASTIYRDENGTELFNCELDDYHIKSYEIKNGGFAKIDSEGNALTWYLVSTTTEGEDTIKLVKSVKTNEVFANGNYTSSFDKLKIVSANWDEGTATIPAFGAYSGTYSKEILFIYVPDDVTALPDRIAQNTPAIVCEITPSSKLTSLGIVGLYGAKSLREFYIPSGVTGDISSQYAEGASRLEKVEFGQGCSITALRTNAFYGCSSLKSISLPNTVETLESRVFQNCSRLEYINLGASLTYMNKTSNNHSFAFCATKLKTVVIPASFVASNIESNLDYSFQPGWGNTQNITFYYTGTEADFELLQEKFSTAGNNGEIVGATVENGRLVLTNHCEAFYGGVHEEDNNPCVVNCTRCNSFGVAEKNPVHAESTTISYANGYDKVGSLVTGCTNEGCTHNTTTEAPALFICFGVSVPENEGVGIAVGFAVNSAAIADYTELTGKTLTYGIFAVSENKLGENDVLNADGTAANGVISTEIKNTDHGAFEIKVVGFTTDEQKNALLALGAYVIATKGEGKTISYIQDGTPAEGDKYYFVSYNGLNG